METEKDKPRAPLQEGEIPKDLARLKNWSNFEEASYRDFSQQRAERRSVAHRRVEEIRKAQPGAMPVPDPAPVAAPTSPATLSAAAESAPLLTNPNLAPQPAPAAAPAVPAASRAVHAQSSAARTAVAVFSLTGGVGKSMLSAHLARSLYTRGERVLLVNASGHGLLSMYFGSSEEREGLRQFCAPGETHASVLLCHRDHPDRTWLHSDVAPLMQNVDRTVFDLGNASLEFIEDTLALCQVVLVPVVPSPQAVYSVRRVLALIERIGAHLPSGIRVYLVLNQFSEEREQHEEMKRSLESLCGDGFAPVLLSISDELHQAFDERMTLGDYHPSAPLSLQFERLAGWLRKILPPSTPAQGRRWSEV